MHRCNLGGNMRDYQRKRTKYILPDAVYNRTIWTIRDYHRIKDELNTMLVPERSGPQDDPTYQKAVKYSDFIETAKAIDKARNGIPEEYRDGVWKSVLYRTPYPKNAERSTYGHLKSRFVFEVASLLHYI